MACPQAVDPRSRSRARRSWPRTPASRGWRKSPTAFAGPAPREGLISQPKPRIDRPDPWPRRPGNWRSEMVVVAILPLSTSSRWPGSRSMTPSSKCEFRSSPVQSRTHRIMRLLPSWLPLLRCVTLNERAEPENATCQPSGGRSSPCRCRATIAVTTASVMSLKAVSVKPMKKPRIFKSAATLAPSGERRASPQAAFKLALSAWR